MMGPRAKGPRAKALAVTVAGGLASALVMIACQPGEPGLEPRTPPNAPLPTKLDRPDDPITAPKSPSDAG